MRISEQPTGKANHAYPQLSSEHVEAINNVVVSLNAEKHMHARAHTQTLHTTLINKLIKLFHHLRKRIIIIIR